MFVLFLEFLCCLGVLLALAFHIVAWWRLLHASTQSANHQPGVSIMKPLKGADPGLADNLRSFFELDYPDYELVFGIQEAQDPALAVLEDVCKEYPNVTARWVISDRMVGINQKVNNLANILNECHHECILISDSNVAVDAHYLDRLVEHLQRPGIGMVTSLIRGSGDRGLGGALEAVQLNSFVLGGVAVASALPRQVCAVGKSMMLRRRDLERIGGMKELARYLAEDQVCGEKIADLGKAVEVSCWPVDNVLGKQTIRGFASRHLRWAQIRRRIAPTAYAAEILSNPVPASLVNLAANPGLRSFVILCITVFAMAGISLRNERMLGIKRHPLVYLPLEGLRGLVLAVLWPVPFCSSTLTWRGHSYRIEDQTLLVPMDEVGGDEDWTEELFSLEG